MISAEYFTQMMEAKLSLTKATAVAAALAMFHVPARAQAVNSIPNLDHATLPLSNTDLIPVEQLVSGSWHTRNVTAKEAFGSFAIPPFTDISALLVTPTGGAPRQLKTFFSYQGITASMLATGAAAANLGTSFALNNASLSALASTSFPAIARIGYAAAGDAPFVVYASQPSACSLNAGSGDGGLQVRSSDGKCWVAQFPASGADVRAWGCFPDGVTDVGACLNTAQANYRGKIVVPASDAGFYVNTTVQANWNLIGEAFSAVNNMPGNLYPRTSWFKCSASVSPCVRAAVNGSLSYSPVLENIIIAGASGTPIDGATGLQIAGGYNVNLRNVFVVNFDTCLQLGPESTYAGLSFNSVNLSMGACKSHHLVNDGWPEAKFIGGRWGLNGAGDYASAQDYVLQTLTTTVGSGGGPNTLLFDDVQFNSSNGIACAFNWEGFTGSGGIQGETRISNSHVEFHHYTGSHKQGIFCSDNTTPVIESLFVNNMLTATGGITVPLFNLDAATAPAKWFFANNQFGCSGISLALPAVAETTNSGLHFTDNVGCSSASFTGNANALLFSSGNKWGALTIAGAWSQFSSIGDHYTALTDTATGNVVMSNPLANNWTPSLKFGGENTGLTTSVNSAVVIRDATGGFTATFNIQLTAKGSSTGAATVTGLPYTCASGNGAQPLSNATGMAGLSGVPVAAISSATVLLYNGSPSGLTTLTDANFSNSTLIYGVVKCTRAQ